jgi:hypothetical protein
MTDFIVIENNSFPGGRWELVGVKDASDNAAGDGRCEVEGGLKGFCRRTIS